MSYIELFLLAAGLCFDTFAVSLTGGICTRGSLCVRQILKIILCFAFFQAGLSFAGWLLGYSVSDYIARQQLVYKSFHMRVEKKSSFSAYRLRDQKASAAFTRI